MNSKNKGNGLLVVLIILAAIAFGVYSVSDLVNTEFRLTQKAELYNEAKQAAESIVQSGVAELHIRLENSAAVREDMLEPTNAPLSVSNEFLAAYSGDDSNVVIPTVTQYTDSGDFFTQDTEIIGGRISPWVSKFIDPDEMGNENDNQAGLTIGSRTVEIFGKATVEHPLLGSTTVHASQFVEIREIPLFTFAIYYNLPLEIAPGPQMDIYGNVHVNGDAWIQANRGLNFHGNVTIAGDLYHGRHPDSGMRERSGTVNFTNGESELINLKKNDQWPAEAKESFSGTWLESIIGENRVDNFGNLVSQIWDGNLATADNDVEPIRLPGVSDYIEDTNESTAQKESFNSAYTIIEPTVDEIDVPSAADDFDGYQEALARKAAEKNKFSYMAGLTIEVAENGNLSYYKYNRDGYGNIQYNSDGSPQKTALVPTKEIASYKPYNTSNGTVTSGLYDKRQQKGMNLIEVDVSKLKDLVHENNNASWGTTDAPEDWWTGVVYVEFPQANAESNRPDNVNPAKSNDWGVKLVEGATVPNPAFAQSKGIYGTSIATNQAMYVEGNYNSDGNLGTGSATTPDSSSNFNGDNGEAPAALAADAVTFLSVNWDDSKSNTSISNRVAASTEVSAAILTGLVPSGENGSNSYSGGVENFPRFLEKWGGKDFVMRGSIVAMFESEVATAGWGSGDVYSPPTRKWGFHENYTDTPPPGPRIRDYRGRDLRILSAADYTARVGLNW